MSIKSQIKIIDRVNTLVANLQAKYSHNHLASIELNKLDNTMQSLKNYLMNLDQLKPNYNTNEIDEYVKAINLHMDILQVELETQDYFKLKQGIGVIRTILKFHPVKYSFFTFIAAWLFEWVYFI